LLVGFTITPEELLNQVRNYATSSSIAGWNALGTTLNALRGSSELRWANPLEVKDTVEKVFLETFGPKVAKSKVKVRVIDHVFVSK
jgi:glutaminyl-tRNA synthetase